MHGNFRNKYLYAKVSVHWNRISKNRVRYITYVCKLVWDFEISAFFHVHIVIYLLRCNLRNIFEFGCMYLFVFYNSWTLLYETDSRTQRILRFYSSKLDNYMFLRMATHNVLQCPSILCLYTYNFLRLNLVIKIISTLKFSRDWDWHGIFTIRSACTAWLSSIQIKCYMWKDSYHLFFI